MLPGGQAGNLGEIVLGQVNFGRWCLRLLDENNVPVLAKRGRWQNPKNVSYLTDDATLKTRSTSYVIETDRKVEGLVKRRCGLSFWISPALPVSMHGALGPICRSLGMPWHARVPQWCRCSVLTISNPLVLDSIPGVAVSRGRFTVGLGDNLL